MCLHMGGLAFLWEGVGDGLGGEAGVGREEERGDLCLVYKMNEQKFS